jgi:hypothetical protein
MISTMRLHWQKRAHGVQDGAVFESSNILVLAAPSRQFYPVNMVVSIKRYVPYSPIQREFLGLNPFQRKSINVRPS